MQILLSPNLVNAFYLQGHRWMYMIPPSTTTISRRLFPGRNIWARLTVSTLPLLPQFRIGLTSFDRFDLFRESEDSVDEEPGARLPSNTGLDSGVTFWDAGIELTGWLPSLVGQFGVHFQELGIRIKSGLNLGLMTQKVTIGASWFGDNSTNTNNVGVDVGVGTDGVVLSLE